MAGREFSVDGIAGYHYQGDVDRDPIVFVHGGTMGAWGWEPWANYLQKEQGWNCFSFDWFNHGKSTKLPLEEFVDRTIEDVARREIPAIVQKVTSCTGGKVIIIGHSMGGLATATYASENPDRVRAAVMVSPVVPIQVQEPAIEVPITFGQTFGPFPYELAKEYFFTTMTEEQAKALHGKLTPESAVAAWEATRWTGFFRTSKLTVPRLVMAASLDSIVPPRSAKVLAELTGAEHIEFEGLGHVDITMKDPAEGQPDWRTGASYLAQWLTSKTGYGRPLAAAS